MKRFIFLAAVCARGRSSAPRVQGARSSATHAQRCGQLVRLAARPDLGPALRGCDRRPRRLQPDRLGRRDPGDPEPPGRLRRERRAADARPVQRVQRLRPDSVGALGTSVAYNLQGAPPHLKITGPVIANIFLGKIKKWNDPAIKKLNPGVNLPDTEITPIWRSDGSGTTYNFTDYLSNVSPAVEVEGRHGHAGELPGRHRRPRLVGRLRRALADERRHHLRRRRVRLKNHFSFFSVKNKAGKYQLPGSAQIKAAMRHGDARARRTTRSRSSTRRSRRRRPTRSARSRT